MIKKYETLGLKKPMDRFFKGMLDKDFAEVHHAAHLMKGSSS